MDAKTANVLCRLSAIVIVLASASCASIDPPKQEVAYENYEKIPVLPTSKVYRRVLKAVPIIRSRVFYGRYGGFGNKGAPPIDPLDDLFRKHDIVYYEANHYGAMVTADSALVAALQKLDPELLRPRGQKFRENAILYFRSPSSLVVGKPVTSPWPRFTRPTLFPTPASIRRFMTEPEIKFPEPIPPPSAPPSVDLTGSSRQPNPVMSGD